MRKVIFRLKSGGKQGQKTSEQLRSDLDNYRKKLIEDGEEILSETEEEHNRFGSIISIELK